LAENTGTRGTMGKSNIGGDQLSVRVKIGVSNRVRWLK